MTKGDGCPICGRKQEGDSEFCDYHERALASLQSSFLKWQIASEISWVDYLDEVSNADETGTWVRDIIDYLMSRSDPSAMKESP